MFLEERQSPAGCPSADKIPCCHSVDKEIAMKRLLILVVAIFAVTLYAADFWVAKEPGQWTDDEVDKMLTKSPWAKKVTPESSMQAMAGGGGGDMGGGGMGGGPPGVGGGGMGGGPPGGGGGGMGGGPPGGGGGGMGGGGGVPGGGGQSASPVVLRWEGAALIREANARNQFAHAAQLAEWSKEYYVISLTGLQSGPAGRGAPGEGGRENGNRQGGQRQGDPRGGTPPGGDNPNMGMPNFRSLSLKYSDKRTISPEKIMVIRMTEGSVFYVLFSRKNAITVADKDMTFEADVDQGKIKAKFKLKDMEYKGKLDL